MWRGLNRYSRPLCRKCPAFVHGLVKFHLNHTLAYPLKLYNQPMAKRSAPEELHERGLALEIAKPEITRPPLYSVMVLNDDFTPMDFVVEVLEFFFAMNREKATQVMLHVHTRGRGVCGVFTRDVAESKVTQVNEFSRSHQHPLLCVMEKA